MKGLVIDKLINGPKFFSLEEPDLEVFGSLPEWLQNTIKENLNFKGSPLEEALNGSTSQDKEKKEEQPKKEKETPTDNNEEDGDDKPW